MLIPYNTDAPLYHPPFATVGLIIVNILLFIPVFVNEDAYDMQSDDWAYEEFEEDFDFESSMAELTHEDGTPLSPEEAAKVQAEFEQLVEAARQQRTQPRARPIWRYLTLEFGRFRPWQWLTANYMHADLLHLLGNMFVLWGFGLVVEGKVGWWRFLAIYNLIGIAGWGLVQLVMLWSDEGIGLGASLAIFGILVVALIWAPSNDMQCVFLAGIRPIMFEASILIIASFALFLQLGISLLHIITMTHLGLGVRITSEVLHLIGGVFGLGVGILMVKRHWVDCENWDLFSVWAGKNLKTREEDQEDVAARLERIKQLERKRLAACDSEPHGTSSFAPRAAAPLAADGAAEFRALVARGALGEAGMLLHRLSHQTFGWSPPEPDFVQYISALRKQQQHEAAAAAMYDYLNRYSEREVLIRLALAQLLIQALRRPQEALQVLDTINEAFLDPRQGATCQKLRAAARQAAGAV